MADVVCLGILVADTVGYPIDRLPVRGMMELVERIELHIGGCAANTGTDLAKLGVSTAVVGKVGADGYGDYLAATLSARGVDTRGLARDPETPTAATIVTVHSDAERSFLHVPGANATFTAADIDWDALSGAKILHVAGLQLLTAFEGKDFAATLAEAKRRGLITTLDTVMNPRSLWWEGVADALPYLDWAIPSLEEAVLLTGERDPVAQAKRLKAGGAANAAIKLGADGCYIAPADSEPFFVPALPIDAVDALGAGDAWAAGFLAGLFYDWPLEKTARFANAVGACCVQRLGATTGVRTLAETLAMIGERESTHP